jgi:hypothetical protein
MKSTDAFKSTYLKAADLRGRRVVVTIDRVVMESVGQGKDAEDKPVMYFRGKDRGLVVNTTNWQRLAAWLGGDESDFWIGRQCILGTEPTTMAGKPTIGLRVVGVPGADLQPASTPPVPPSPPVQSEPALEGDDQAFDDDDLVPF